MGEAGLFGITLPEEYGGLGASHVTYGLVAREIERIDSGYRSMMSVQNSLVMHAIFCLWLRGAAQGLPAQACERSVDRLFWPDRAGCGLRPISHVGARGTDRARIPAHRQQDVDSNAPIADVFVVWAKSQADGGKIRGFLVDKGTPGFSAPRIGGKMSLRVAVTGEIVMDGVEIGKDRLLPGAEGLKAPLGCLDHARYGIVWGVMGAAEFCWHAARQYGLDRKQFGRPLAQTQLFQKGSPTRKRR
jgi:glutaryl-CoA dehydrogenase